MSEYRWTREGCADGYEILLGPDGSEVTCLTEIEDRQGCRDLAPVTDELNALAKRVEELDHALDRADEALDSLWASIGDRFLARGPLSEGYAHSTMRKVQKAREEIAERRKGRA